MQECLVDNDPAIDHEKNAPRTLLRSASKGKNCDVNATRFSGGRGERDGFRPTAPADAPGESRLPGERCFAAAVNGCEEIGEVGGCQTHSWFSLSGVGRQKPNPM